MSNFKFPIGENHYINQCFGQEYQDIFVLSMTQGKFNGTYLEIGAADPIAANNTYLLSEKFNWSGISIDINPEFQSRWQTARPKDNFQCLDALNVNYRDLLKKYYPDQSTIDYLQLDVDPAHNTLSCLKKLPHDLYRFRVITFETDAYTAGNGVRDQSRTIFKSLGYELVVGDVLYINKHPFEDWYIDPRLVDRTVWNKLKSLATMSQNPKELLLVNQVSRYLID